METTPANTTSKKNSTSRSRAFRERVAAAGYRRMELTVDMPSIERLRAVAKARKIGTWEALNLAVRLLVQWHNSDVAGNNRKN